MRGLVALACLACACRGISPAQRAEADAHYRRGIALLSAGDPRARDELRAGTELAPMDPPLYLPLARACRDRGLDQRAAEFYRKYLRANPRSLEAARELAALSTVDVIIDERPPLWPLLVALSLALLVALAWTRYRRALSRRFTLARLAADNPELQPAIAHLCGCLRHELFKHRVLAVADAVRALASGNAVAGQREFLLTRLYGGAPLTVAWAGHLASFIRALGPRFDLSRHDPEWSAAGRALAQLARLEVLLLRDEADAAARLHATWQRLEAFDRKLASQLAAITHTAIDRRLLDEVVEAIRAEQPGGVEITVGEVAPDLRVEVYRVDLVLVLKNLLRNAARAALLGDSPARVRVDVGCEVEPTGEEVVRVRVRDTHPEPPPPASAARRDRGLGIIDGVLERYDGALEVGPGDGEWKKSVSVRLFRALDPLEAAA